MKTNKQKQLVDSYLSQFGKEVIMLYQDIISFLSELGYYPKKVGPSISFINDVHGKQIVKFGASIKKSEAPTPWFSLRFSSCNDYSQRFADIVRDTIIKVTANNVHRHARCLTGECAGCKGEPESHIYSYAFPDGKRITSCGIYAIKIPVITMDDVNEINMLIQEEHEHLKKNEMHT